MVLFAPRDKRYPPEIAERCYPASPAAIRRSRAIVSTTAPGPSSCTGIWASRAWAWSDLSSFMPTSAAVSRADIAGAVCSGAKSPKLMV